MFHLGPVKSKTQFPLPSVDGIMLWWPDPKTTKASRRCSLISAGFRLGQDLNQLPPHVWEFWHQSGNKPSFPLTSSGEMHGITDERARLSLRKSLHLGNKTSKKDHPQAKCLERNLMLTICWRKQRCWLIEEAALRTHASLQHAVST